MSIYDFKLPNGSIFQSDKNGIEKAAVIAQNLKLTDYEIKIMGGEIVFILNWTEKRLNDYQKEGHMIYGHMGSIGFIATNIKWMT